jgi:DNA repair protein RadC
MLTQRLKEAAEIIGVRLLDHVIFGDGDRYVSLKERGQM